MLPDGFTRFPWYRRWFGRRSERWAAKFLRRSGFWIIGQNIQDTLGEIDLLAIDGGCVVIVEVRSSESRSLDDLARTVNLEKQRRLTDATVRFVKRRKLWNVPVRFDVLAVRWPPESREPEVLHLRHAFQAVGRFQLHS
ncbi:YraN family protein [Zavarzinella formosa]|uniref:YraN family protein n=1 Tax=Zavarzinella formosa TaxID=360055 RepID=UPI0002E5380B|nr:YraN family protein [Zavarzinella formosa]